MSEPSPQMKVGILAILTLIVLAGIITWKSDILVTRTGTKLIGSFQNIEGVTLGSEIRYRGFKVGKITSIDPGPEDIRIYGVIDRRINFPADSHLRVAFDGLVGLKFLEIIPGKSLSLHKQDETLLGESTSGIVDFVDMGTQNLAEIKKIIGDPVLQKSFLSIASGLKDLTHELNIATGGLTKILANNEFQGDVKGTIAETHKTLVSANKFFEGVSKLDLKTDAYANFGGVANEVRANVEVGQQDFMRVGVGEGGTTRVVSLQDLQIGRWMSPMIGIRLGMINNTLGTGLDYSPKKGFVFSGDMYSVNNNPSYPRLRLTGERQIMDYVNLMLRIDDILNSATRNFMLGIKVRSLP